MENGVVSVLTAPSIGSDELVALKYHTISSEEERKNLEVFIEDFDRATGALPSGEVEERKGISLFLAGNLKESFPYLLNAKTPAGKLPALRVLIVNGQTEKAKALLNELADGLDGELSVALLAMSACDLNDLECAEKLKSKLGGESPATIFAKACIAQVNGDDQSALDGFLEVSEAEGFPLRGQAMFRKAVILERRGYENDALQTYRDITTLGYMFEEAWINMGILLDDKGEYSDALRCYEQAMKINPVNTIARNYYKDAEASMRMHYDERKMKQDLKTTEILAMRIEDFELSVRSRNCLTKMGIKSLHDLITKTESELLSYKNFGETSLKEIRAMLDKKGLKLGMNKVEDPLDGLSLGAFPKDGDSSVSMSRLDDPIEKLDLSYRTKSTLHKLGYESLRDITMRTGHDLESNDKINPACLQEINALMEELGLSFRPSTTSSSPSTPQTTVSEGAGDTLLDDEAEEETIVNDAGTTDEDEHYDDE